MSERSFSDWADEWIRLATYTGRALSHVDERIERVLELWHDDIPGTWRRGEDSRLLNPERRYCRSNYAPDARRRGEHQIEYDLLGSDPAVRRVDVMGARLVDGVTAVPLARDSAGGRTGNVEADLLLLVRDSRGDHCLEVVEVKVTANDGWYASVENLRQLRLAIESEATRNIFAVRQPELGLHANLALAGLVLAPTDFYRGVGRKGCAVVPAQRLLDRVHSAAGVCVRLGTWDGGSIRELERDP